MRIGSRCLLLLLQPYFLVFKKSRISYKAYLNRRTTLEGYNVVGENSLVAGAKIGRATYISPLCNFSNSNIGRFCSIGRNVRIIDGVHPTEKWVSTHPSFFSTARQAGFSFVDRTLFEEHRFVDKERGIVVEIGNDVWIGNNVSIMAGVRIGDGAIIATGAVVVKDVPPYAIVGGIPATLIRHRFDPTVISALMGIRWWDFDMEQLRFMAGDFSDVEQFVEKYRE